MVTLIAATEYQPAFVRIPVKSPAGVVNMRHIAIEKIPQFITAECLLDHSLSEEMLNCYFENIAEADRIAEAHRFFNVEAFKQRKRVEKGQINRLIVSRHLSSNYAMGIEAALTAVTNEVYRIGRELELSADEVASEIMIVDGLTNYHLTSIGESVVSAITA